nr:toprim domain-containing protein [Geodermatophilaceae bacterium]
PPFDPYLDPAPADPAQTDHSPDLGTLPPLLVDLAGGDPADYLLEEHRWATADVPRARLVDLNTEAAGYFAARYPESWAASYLTERLGSDLADDPRFAAGYAPAGWTGLVEHLRALGATDTEILAAGLGSRTRTGNLIDRFRDRLVFPIHGADGDIHGFIGRRNPATDDADRAGPKYLNTPETDLYRKGAQLLGLHEGRDALADGATPVLVEGPIDAYAVTLAGDGRYVGAAPLGTAFTDRQADQLRPYIRDGRPGIVVATDADPAGERAAERAYWQLTARGDNPARLAMSDGLDPADVLRTGGTTTLQQALQESGSLAEHLVNQRISAATHNTATAEERVAAIRAAAEVIGALRPNRWLHHIDRVTDVLDAVPGSVHLEVIEAGTAWILDPAGQAAARLNRRAPGVQPAPQKPDVERWRDLAHSIDPRLPGDGGWPMLADALTRAHNGGYDVNGQLPHLAAQHQLPDRNPATELRYRLHADTHTANPPPDIAAQWQAATSTGTRHPQPVPPPARERNLPRDTPGR